MTPRKKLISKKPERVLPETAPVRKWDKRIDFKSLPGAIQDGKVAFSIGDELAVRKMHNSKCVICTCAVRVIDGDKVETWDMTLERWFAFTPTLLEKHGVEVKVLKRATTPPAAPAEVKNA